MDSPPQILKSASVVQDQLDLLLEIEVSELEILKSHDKKNTVCTCFMDMRTSVFKDTFGGVMTSVSLRLITYAVTNHAVIHVSQILFPFDLYSLLAMN